MRLDHVMVITICSLAAFYCFNREYQGGLIPAQQFFILVKVGDGPITLYIAPGRFPSGEP